MKIKWICLIFCLLLSLAGCNTTRDPSNENTSPVSEESQNQTESNEDAGNDLDNEAVMKAIIDDAPAMSLLAVLTNPDTDIYRSFDTPAQSLDLSDMFPNTQMTTLLFFPIQEDIQILVEEIEYSPTLNWFNVINTLYDFSAETGRHYVLNTPLSEGTPQIRITAVWNDRQLSWYCVSEEGFGDDAPDGVYYLSFSYEDELWFDYDAPYTIPLSGAAAVNHLLFSETAFWETVAQAITLTEDSSGNPIILSQERFYQYVETIYPGLTAWPELIEEIHYSESDNTYILDPYTNDAIATWELSHVEENPDGRGGSVWIDVTCPNLDDFPILFEVVWRLNDIRGENGPFDFHITDIVLHEAMG